jgi:hypothetical protein
MAYSNGGIQKSRSNGDQPLPMQVGGNPATGPSEGGSKILVNMDEAVVLDSTIEDSPYLSVENTWNGVEDDSHVQGVYAEHDYAGS